MISMKNNKAEATQAAREENEERPFYYTVGADIEMFFEGQWIAGKVIDGYRFRDGIITMETPNGKRIWCSEASASWRRPERG